jgi:hypothetical protein
MGGGDMQKMIAKPQTIRRAIEALEKKGPSHIEHVYDKNQSEEADAQCLKKLHQLLSSSRAAQRQRC